MSDSDDDLEGVKRDPAVSRDQFVEWRSPRLGRANPEPMDNPVWVWLIRTGINAWLATEAYDGPSAMDAGPGWCFDRYGQSSTELPDGRVVLIAGEHEDGYDPDFFIYNDVVVRHPNGGIDIYGYPRETFPPTDFHSATLAGDRIILLGSLGYADQRRPGETQVMVLDLSSFAIKAVTTKGIPPGWIHNHTAELDEDSGSIVVRRGLLEVAEGEPLVENIDDWRLWLSDWRWERLTERNWKRWLVRRKDGEGNHLFDYQQEQWEAQVPALAEVNSELAEMMENLDIPTLEQAIGGKPDLELYANRYTPPLPHAKLPDDEDEFRVYRIEVAGVVVRYVEDMDHVQMTVEGDLPDDQVQVLLRDLVDKLSRLENSKCEMKELP